MEQLTKRETIALAFAAKLLSFESKDSSTKHLNQKAFQLADSFIKNSNT